MQEFRTMGSMADMLMRFVSTSTVRDSNYEIVLLLINNYGKVRHMSQKQMAELCFVSEAGISRFCRFLGFESFRDFKMQLEQDFSIQDDYSKRMQKLMKSSSKEVSDLFRDELTGAVESTVNEGLFHQAKMMAEIIHDTGRVFLSHIIFYGMRGDFCSPS